MKFCIARPKFAVLLPCVGVVALGALTAMADPEERTGADAPHQERTQAKNERKSALSVSALNVPVVADKPIRKATAVKTGSTDRKSKDKKKAEQQAAKAKAKAETPATSTVDDRPRYDDIDDRVGSDAPHQERSSDPTKRGTHLIIFER